MYEPAPTPPPPKKKALAKKDRVSVRGHALPERHNGGYSEVEYALDYDAYDSRPVEGKYDDRSKGPKNWSLMPVRNIIGTFSNEERAIELGRDLIRSHGNQQESGRPGKVMKRTVTYGPWEEIASTDEQSEGWY